MVRMKTPAPRITTRPTTAMAMIVASVFLGGAITEASAKSRQHRHHHSQHSASDSWRSANASLQSGGGRSFSGMASYYGNESGSRTASGQRFNQHAMTAAHRSLPFGTKLKVTHGEPQRRRHHQRSRPVHSRPGSRSVDRRGARHRPDQPRRRPGRRGSHVTIRARRGSAEQCFSKRCVRVAAIRIAARIQWPAVANDGGLFLL